MLIINGLIVGRLDLFDPTGSSRIDLNATDEIWFNRCSHLSWPFCIYIISKLLEKLKWPFFLLW